MYFGNPAYFLTIGLQAFCVWHSVRNRTNQQWIWLIVFVPVIGALIYLFSEVFSRRTVQNAGAGLGELFTPGGSIGRLERALQFSDTMANRIELGKAYATAGRTDDAVALFESCLDGPFHDPEAVFAYLIPLYFLQGRYAEILPMAQTLYGQPEFRRSRNHLLYALALEQEGDAAAAGRELQEMQGRYSFYEARYHYGCFLRRHGRGSEGDALFRQLVEEGRQLTGLERRTARVWTQKAADALKASAVAA